MNKINHIAFILLIGVKIFTTVGAAIFDSQSLLNDLARNYTRSFTILDLLNSNGDHYKKLPQHLNLSYVIMQKNFLPETIKSFSIYDQVILLEHDLVGSEIIELSECESFDVLLASIKFFNIKDFELLNALKNLSSIIVFVDDSGGDQELFSVQEKMLKQSACKILCRGIGCLAISGNDKILTKGWFRGNLKHYAVINTLRRKYFVKNFKNIPRSDRKVFFRPSVIDQIINWDKGINLWTYIMFNGIYPTKSWVEDKLRKLFAIPGYCNNHIDNNPWNFIIQGKKLIPIDCAPKKQLVIDLESMRFRLGRAIYWLYNPPWHLTHIK